MLNQMILNRLQLPTAKTAQISPNARTATVQFAKQVEPQLRHPPILNQNG
jgi:hypothetical protein